MTESPMRVVAIDWSGDKSGGAKQIWLAEARGGQIVRLENGRTRDQLAEHLVDVGSKDPNIVVGLDFAFSMPKWFVEEEGASSGPEFWNVVAQKGESWLRDCPWPFWGRSGTTKPRDVELLRQTESQIKDSDGPSPSSVFLIAGGAQVGTGSIRGMPLLARMHEAGWHVWPFDPPEEPPMIEIYPRLFMGPVVKKSPEACLAFLGSRFPNLDSNTARLAASIDDAFDATVSALVMAQHVEALRELPWPLDPIDTLEGRIWNTPSPLSVSESSGLSSTGFR